MRKEIEMMKVTYEIYSKLLDKTHTNVKFVSEKKDFDLFNLAVHHGQATIIKEEEIA